MSDIQWSNKARRQLRKLSKNEQPRIVEAVRRLEDFPDVKGDIKSLSNHAYDYYRLRVGRYRVLFNYDGTIHIIYIEEVTKRDERTY